MSDLITMSDKIILGGIERSRINTSKLKPPIDLNFIERYNKGFFEQLGVYNYEECFIFTKNHTVESLTTKLENIKKKYPDAEIKIKFVNNGLGTYSVVDAIMYGINESFKTDKHNFLYFLTRFDLNTRFNYMDDIITGHDIDINKFLRILSIYSPERHITINDEDNFYMFHSGDNIVILPFSDKEVDQEDIWYLR